MPNKGISHVSVSFFCLTLPKNFVRDPFCVSEKFWYRNILWIGREYHMFPSIFFRLTLPKNFVGGTPRCFRTFLVSNNFIDKKGRRVGVSQISIENFLSHSNDNLRRGTFLCFRESGESKKFMHKGGGGGGRGVLGFSVGKFFIPFDQKNS